MLSSREEYARGSALKRSSCEADVRPSAANGLVRDLRASLDDGAEKTDRGEAESTEFATSAAAASGAPTATVKHCKHSLSSCPAHAATGARANGVDPP